MFLKWRRRLARFYHSPHGPHGRYRLPKPVRIDAWEIELVESARTPAGPRQRHVAYLGRIELPTCEPLPDEEEGPGDVGGRLIRAEILKERARFWDGLTRRLDRLDDRLPNGMRRAIEEQVAARVPRP